jgi:murein DD-endopeptidase MepM/ murein hydrolase activator NlpD
LRVVLTAVLGSVIVALGAGAVLPNPNAAADDPVQAGLQDQLNAANQSNANKPSTGLVDQGATDLWLLPLHYNYEITTLFQMRWGLFHTGVDMACPLGTPYYAAHAGTVIVARWYGGFGNGIVIDAGNGILNIYGHASKLLVTEGQHVNAGDLLGLVGSTGYSTGDHLHYEVHINVSPSNPNGTAVDPIPFMRTRGVDIPNHTDAADGGIVVN